jgi:hypothetical protein
MRRIAVYNGQRWDMGPTVTPEQFLAAALVPHYPDLAGATYVRTETPEAILFEFGKTVGEKG